MTRRFKCQHALASASSSSAHPPRNERDLDLVHRNALAATPRGARRPPAIRLITSRNKLNSSHQYIRRRHSFKGWTKSPLGPYATDSSSAFGCTQRESTTTESNAKTESILQRYQRLKRTFNPKPKTETDSSKDPSQDKFSTVKCVQEDLVILTLLSK